MIFLEYEEEKNSLLRLLADASNDKSSEFSEKKVIDIINKSFDVFEGLGWIVKDTQDKDKFKYMPSFERLRKMYEAQIIGIENLIRENGKEK